MDQNKEKTVAVIDCASKKTPEIQGVLSDLGINSDIIALKDANQQSFDSNSAMIISGGPHLFTDSQEKKNSLMQQFQFIQNLAIPTLGICLGHQAIALTFGGDVYRDHERREKDKIQILKNHPLFEQISEESEFAEDHCEGIRPGSNTTVIARSEYYEVEAIKIDDRPMLGVQFHPEVSGKNGHQLISNFINWADTQP
ncbi:glutamine amidotransferase-related protein [Endozoicomonas arenosclerae]|uniref:glutamine amidotransferase-related protein n=1 Tax=Endozoicomonas arenosclerae TaxID=1633495 RepID=UPI00078084F0|nr:gamma-glutamyl-gamma-aminobutyrate hydrolase family protein [Endozoicomonas arenosclerae]